MKKIVDLIKEEVYDYLNNDKRTKEKETDDILTDDLFQDNFIDDCIDGSTKLKKYVSDNDINSSFRKYGETKENYIDIDVTISYEYTYDSSKDPLKFNIDFIAEKVAILDGELNNEEDINNINWIGINVVLMSRNGDKINFKMFDKASNNIKISFIKSNIKNILIEGLL